MILKENKKFRNMFIVTEYAALTKVLLGNLEDRFSHDKVYIQLYEI